MGWLDIAIFIFGLLSGSLINCLAWRLPRAEKIFWARSRCPLCQKALGVLELIPIFSFLRQKARCRGCGKKISWQYPAVELAAALMFWTAYYFGPWMIGETLAGMANATGAFVIGLAAAKLFLLWLILSSLFLIFLIDWREGVILDITIWPLATLLLVVAFFDGDFLFKFGAALCAAAFFGAQYLFSRGRWLGAGDIGLGFLLGALLGWPRILAALFLAYVSGAIVSLPLLIFKKKKLKDAVPLGAFLTPAAFVALLWGDKIIRWYWNLLS